MNGWIIALLILSGISAYIGVAALYYYVAVEIFKEPRDEDTTTQAVFWPFALFFMLLWSPIALILKIIEMIDEEADNDNKR